MPDFILGCTHLQTPSGLGSFGSLRVKNISLMFRRIRQERKFNVKPNFLLRQRRKILVFLGWINAIKLLN